MRCSYRNNSTIASAINKTKSFSLRRRPLDLKAVDNVKYSRWRVISLDGIYIMRMSRLETNDMTMGCCVLMYAKCHTHIASHGHLGFLKGWLDRNHQGA